MAAEDDRLRDRDVRLLFGRDIAFDLTKNAGADFTVTASGDWASVEGERALRQAVIRRLITSPGEWATLPEYGAGMRNFIKKKLTTTARDQITDRIKSQLLRDPRIARVNNVELQSLDDTEGLQVIVVVTPRGKSVRNTLDIRAVIV